MSKELDHSRKSPGVPKKVKWGEDDSANVENPNLSADFLEVQSRDERVHVLEIRLILIPN